MTCTQAQGYITPFINDQIDVNELEEFLNHIENCQECREELEVYYTLLTAMKQLDEEHNMPDEYHMGLLHKIKRAEEKIVHYKVQSIRKRFILATIIAVVSFLSSFGIQEYVIEEVEKENNLTTAPFDINYYYFRDRHTELDQFIEEHGRDMVIYTIKEEMNKIESEGDKSE